MHTTSYPQQSLSQSDATLMIDDFVTKVLNSTGLAYRTPSHPEARISRRLQHYMPYLRAMVDVFIGRVDYGFSEPLELFNEARLKIRLESIGSRFACLAPHDDAPYFLSDPECLNLLIECIREKSQSGGYVRSLRDRIHNANIQSQELKEYVETVMEVCPRTMVVRGNFHYIGAFKSWFRVGDVFSGRCLLLNAIASHSVFAGLTGYILGIEQSDRLGFYIHAAFFFDASRVKGERAQQIEKLWVEITEGRGCWSHVDQGSAGWSRGDWLRTTGVFYRAEVSTTSRVAKGMTGTSRASKGLRIKPQNGQAILMGEWP